MRADDQETVLLPMQCEEDRWDEVLSSELTRQAVRLEFARTIAVSNASLSAP
jgi:hypothetical protein